MLYTPSGNVRSVELEWRPTRHITPRATRGLADRDAMGPNAVGRGPLRWAMAAGRVLVRPQRRLVSARGVLQHAAGRESDGGAGG